AYGGVGQRWPDRNQHEQHDEPEHDDEGDRAKPVALVHPVDSLVDRHDAELFPGNGRHGPSPRLLLVRQTISPRGMSSFYQCLVKQSLCCAARNAPTASPPTSARRGRSPSLVGIVFLGPVL